VGFFGTHAFASDEALDLFDDLATRPTHQHPALLQGLLTAALDPPALDPLGDDDLRHLTAEVVAAAGIVASGLSGGEPYAAHLRALADRELAPDLAPHAAPPALVATARQALRGVTAPGTPWHSLWLDAAEATAARATVDDLDQLLTLAVRPAAADDPCGRAPRAHP
jgi:Domain of unknown function (DUF4259)